MTREHCWTRGVSRRVASLHRAHAPRYWHQAHAYKYYQVTMLECGYSLAVHVHCISGDPDIYVSNESSEPTSKVSMRSCVLLLLCYAMLCYESPEPASQPPPLATLRCTCAPAAAAAPASHRHQLATSSPRARTIRHSLPRGTRRTRGGCRRRTRPSSSDRPALRMPHASRLGITSSTTTTTTRSHHAGVRRSTRGSLPTWATTWCASRDPCRAVIRRRIVLTRNVRWLLGAHRPAPRALHDRRLLA